MIRKFQGNTPEIHADAYVDNAAVLIGKVKVGARSSIWPGAVLRGDIEPITIGDGSNVQEGAVLHTDEHYPTVVGDDVTIGHAAVVHGCEIGDHALIGIGAIVLSGAKIGPRSVVAAGALVPEGTVVDEGTLVMGTPAKKVRELTENEKYRFLKNARAYADRSQEYLKEQKEQG